MLNKDIKISYDTVPTSANVLLYLEITGIATITAIAMAISKIKSSIGITQYTTATSLQCKYLLAGCIAILLSILFNRIRNITTTRYIINIREDTIKFKRAYNSALDKADVLFTTLYIPYDSILSVRKLSFNTIAIKSLPYKVIEKKDGSLDVYESNIKDGYSISKFKIPSSEIDNIVSSLKQKIADK